MSSTTVSTRRVDSSTSGPLISTPSCAPRPVPTSSAVGVARPSAQGHAMISTATAAVNAAFAPAPAPSQKRQRRDRERDHDRHEHARHPVGQPLDRGLAALRVLDEAGHPGELGVGADPRGAHHQTAADVGAPADDRGARPHLDRHRLAGEHRGVQRGAAVLDHAVGGDRLAGADHEAVADLQARRGHPYLAAVAQHRRLLGAEVEQRGERGTRPTLGAGLEPPAEQHERGDARPDLEVGHALAAQQRDDGPAQRGERAERDQGVHGRGAVAQVGRGRAVQRPRAPDDGGRGEHEREPLPAGELERRDHGQHDHGHGQRRDDEEAVAQGPGRDRRLRRARTWAAAAV